MLIILYFIQLIILSIYSWALIDPNITLVNHPLWSRFLEQMLQLGYYQRQLSSFIYIEILVLYTAQFSFHTLENSSYLFEK